LDVDRSAVLRATPGSLSPHLLEQRPGHLPSALYVHGGREPTRFCLVALETEGPRLLHWQGERPELPAVAPGTPLWLRVLGLAEPGPIEGLLTGLGVPPPLLPLLLQTPQRPRVSGFGEALLVVLHRLRLAHDSQHLISSQVGLLLMPNLLITVEEAADGEAFGELTQWLQARGGGPDQRDLDDITHYLLDELLDELFPLLEHVANALSDIEESALRNPHPRLLERSFSHRTNLRTIRSQMWPLRHELRVLLRQGQGLLGPEARAGFEEIGELVELLFQNCELLRHQCDAITQAYAASVGNRMNQVMKTLTILTSIFAPLTFIAGIYGMNFRQMPELSWRYGYPLCLLLMAAVAALQAWWLWRRGWFGDWTGLRRR
jgi:magnesium transporter